MYARASTLPAIAAALVLSSTPAWSQEVQPSAEPVPIVIDPPAPALDSAPIAADEAVVDTSPSAETKTAVESAAAPKAKPKPKAIAKNSAKTATAVRVASAAPAAAASAPEAAPAAPQPIVDARPQANQPAPALEQASAKPALPVDEDALMLGGALALLAIGGGAVAMTRRRRDEEEVVESPVTDESMAAEPVPSPRHDVIHEEQPAIVVPSAFAWGKPQADRNVERREGETWVERAYRGPTPDNPSLSLRKRLKRANFFDARERRVAAGKAEPIPTDAGLPENVETPSTNRERELELA